MRSAFDPIREKRHRLPRECYRGEVAVSFTTCVEGRKLLFADREVVDTFVRCLRRATEQHRCSVLVYCFMPDHAHFILRGMDASADTWRAMVAYKQQSGYWLARSRPAFKLQKDFYDHVIRASENLGDQIRYVLDNPVRRGLVKQWKDYPFTGAVAIDLEAVIEGTVSL